MAIDTAPRVDGQAHAAFDAEQTRQAWLGSQSLEQAGVFFITTHIDTSGEDGGLVAQSHELETAFIEHPVYKEGRQFVKQIKAGGTTQVMGASRLPSGFRDWSEAWGREE